MYAYYELMCVEPMEEKYRDTRDIRVGTATFAGFLHIRRSHKVPDRALVLAGPSLY